MSSMARHREYIEARRLLSEKRYSEAIVLLRRSTHPQALALLSRVEAHLEQQRWGPQSRPSYDSLAPAPSAYVPVAANTNGWAGYQAHTELEMALLRTRSYVPHAVGAFTLLFVAYLPGVVASFVFLTNALHIEHVTGQAPEGKGCLQAVAVFAVLMLIPGVIVSIWLADLLMRLLMTAVMMLSSSRPFGY